MSNSFSLQPRDLNEAMQLADIMSKSEMVPKIYQNKPGNVLVAVQMGADLGMKPMQSLQSIAVVNGNPALWGDGLRAMIMSAPDLVKVEESFDEKTMTATCTVVRSMKGGGESTFTQTFSKAQAEEAGLWGRNTWKQYPKRMLQWRAFGWAARDAYADRLKGVKLAEEVMDYEPAEKEINPAKPESKPKSVADLMKPKQTNYSQDALAQVVDAISYADSLDSLNKTGATIGGMVSSGELTAEEADKAREHYKQKKAELSNVPND